MLPEANDFARELSATLKKRRDVYVDKLVKDPTDRIAGKIEGLKEALGDLEVVRKNFLAQSDEDDSE